MSKSIRVETVFVVEVAALLLFNNTMELVTVYFRRNVFFNPNHLEGCQWFIFSSAIFVHIQKESYTSTNIQTVLKYEKNNKKTKDDRTVQNQRKDSNNNCSKICAIKRERNLSIIFFKKTSCWLTRILI